MSQPKFSRPSTAELAFSRAMDFEYGVAVEVAPGIRRLVANNPGPFTFKGTNTYIVGRGDVAVIDPGPHDAAHRKALLEALEGEHVSHILVTHSHRDHTGGVDAFRTCTGAPVLAYGPTGKPRGARTSSPSGKEFVDETLSPDERLRDGDMIKGAGWSLDVMHTPGHAPDHLCFALVGRRTVFSGDHVMGWNTTVVAPPEGHMGDYIASLERLLQRNDTVFFPAHGSRIQMPQRVVKAYMVHRKWRETAIYDCVSDGLATSSQIAARIYQNLEPHLHGAAALSVLAHLEHLTERGLVRRDGPPGDEPCVQLRFSPA